MTKFALYDSTGMVVLRGSAQVDDINIQANELGLTAFLGEIPEGMFYVKNGEAIELSSEQEKRFTNRPIGAYRWDTESLSWVSVLPFDSVISNSLGFVDTLSGQARLRYITSVPGQSETYTIKERQAREWTAASYAGEPPSFIAAEAAATNVTPQALCQMVIEMADFWSNIKGPQIEAARRKWKVAIESASDSSLIQGLVDAARAELDAL